MIIFPYMYNNGSFEGQVRYYH